MKSFLHIHRNISDMARFQPRGVQGVRLLSDLCDSYQLALDWDDYLFNCVWNIVVMAHE